ncbi:MAG: hypothetical protein A3I26_00710 [Candidatus Yanofskybacteria bacterium RIFCSPLOWO2_02_FULL_43_10]|uniref:Uncharacterized protein n=1 Tax=Candidatus Yanofskybacteria bacterium RIFCSPLOWO2_12_FULL_43_11b TaxID=1802710 RepID=A0A1F8H7L5_9BACT|nr:MAG: hypothetical protein A2742_03925 [Candidatus Yanofskybacteria bacterium RIFCSPHIGHO2_01_FULL_43_32]OGN10947.1 MAG: hypothetical protein A3C69_03135 [Candidatus Yanofskybacteria bacterium RIFCSPHIGHO2_02_FULL_43_12]OGN17096.1 MAG: hypothetical protein A3E34_03445 [Candidatus Yanofskybacteria bacterium RIFCSPHIGHO2_12_FULL_43_11]OGN24430.1 MAG: hypothetical protein A2923_00910 [Candidatus Yanofskybacteria bacterium RIFCSPLOWO2_01_FULL_43_46]OGN28495.1 MAG: hypothetical protein A3I26_00710
MNFKLIKINTLIYVLLFVLLASFLVHNFDSIGQDIGRHLKVGEIIWQTKEVPKTNLFSFTEPDFPFINHHWLSEVIFFGIFSCAGFIGLILVKVFVILAAFLLLFFIAKKHATFWPIVISFVLSIFIFIQRTEVRPEMFSFAILAFFLFALFKAKYSSNYFYLWFLPIAQLFWVNLHIYFFIGPFLITAFLMDRLINKDYTRLKTIVAVLLLTLAATLVNPNGVQGALLPLNILNEYGYSIVENQTLSFLAGFGGFNLSIFIFKLSVAVLAASFLLTIKKARQRIFEILISVFVVYVGFKMLRNLPLYALASFPVLAILLTDVVQKLNLHKLEVRPQVKRLSNFFKVLLSVFVIILIFLVANNSYYKYTKSSRVFGFSAPNGLERAVDFVKQNKIEGPMFNNFDIGGYLIWQLYPQEKVFVDNRPEAYSVEFFNEIYKPMQEDGEKWREFSKKYGINFIFFAHTDLSPWGQNFFNNIVKNQEWKIVYINEDAIILVKNNNKNSGIISRFFITEKRAVDKVGDSVKNSNNNKANLNLALSRILYKMDWLEPSAYFADEVIKIDPNNPYAYLYKGFVRIYYTDEQNQQSAEENIKKAIDLGLKESQYYFILGVVYMNLGRLESAQTSFQEAVRLDKNNEQAKEFLEKYF